MLNYLLETSGGRAARKRLTIEWATLEQDCTDVLRADRLDRTLDLVDMLTEITIQVAIVVAEVRPLQFTHAELRGETEGAFTDVLLGNETLERLASDDETDFVRSRYPRRVAALSETVRDGLSDDWVDEDEVSAPIKTSRT